MVQKIIPMEKRIHTYQVSCTKKIKLENQNYFNNFQFELAESPSWNNSERKLNENHEVK